jgi:hypothetical protein
VFQPSFLYTLNFPHNLANYEAYTGASVFYHLVTGSGSAKAMHERLKSYHVNKKKGGRSAQSAAKTGDTRSN